MKTKRGFVWRNLALYAGAVVALAIACLTLREPPGTEPMGDLAGRFDSQITYPVGDTIAHYREAELTNLLLIGTDGGKDGLAQEGGQADFLLLLTADRETRTLNLTHIDRDTIAEIQTCGIFGDPAGTITTQICLAHAFGMTEDQRCENTVAAVSALFGQIPIDGYLSMDMGSIARLNDALGGVTVTLEEDFSMVDTAMQPGTTITLVGKQAEIYLRYRSMIANATNENRMKRQQTYLTQVIAILEQADAGFLQNLLDTMEGSFSSDWKVSTLLEYLTRWQTYEKAPIQTMVGTHTLDAEGFTAFYPEESWMESYLLNLFYQ